jgi:hypothetical protein
MLLNATLNQPPVRSPHQALQPLTAPQRPLLSERFAPSLPGRGYSFREDYGYYHSDGYYSPHRHYVLSDDKNHDRFVLCYASSAKDLYVFYVQRVWSTLTSEGYINRPLEHKRQFNLQEQLQIPPNAFLLEKFLYEHRQQIWDRESPVKCWLVRPGHSLIYPSGMMAPVRKIYENTLIRPYFGRPQRVMVTPVGQEELAFPLALGKKRVTNLQTAYMACPA